MDEMRRLFRIFIDKLCDKYEGEQAAPTAADDANVIRLMKLTGKDITALIDDDLHNEAQKSVDAVPADYITETE